MARGGRIRSKVVGVTFKNPDRSDRQRLIRKHCRPGVTLILIPEPHNPRSDTAIGVWVATGAGKPPVQIGYVREGLAEDLGRLLEEGASISARVLEVTGGGRGESLGVNYEILASGLFDDQVVATFDDSETAETKRATRRGCGCVGWLVVLLVALAIAFAISAKD